MGKATTRRRAGWRVLWRTVPIVAVGVTVSVALASMVSHRAEADAASRFQTDAEQAVAAVEAEIGRHLAGVDDLEQFISLTWPTPSDVIVGYNQQVWGSERFPAFSPPGIVANVAAETSDEFEQWRRANGDPQFKIWTMGPVPAGDKLVLVGSPAAPGSERGPEGLELSTVVRMLGIELPDVDQGVVFAHNETVTSMLEQLTGIIAEGGALDESNIVGTDALIYAAVPSRDGAETVAYIVVPTRLGELLQQAVDATSQALDMSLSVPGRDDLGEVGRFVQSDNGTMASHHRLEHTVTAAGLEWVVTVGADQGYGGSSAAVSETMIVVIGSLLALLSAALVAMRHAKKQQLAAARFEIDMARTLAETDSLTGLLNRQGLASKLASSASRHAAVLFVDLDGFKAVNDQLGHEAGDRILRETATKMRSALRTDDLLARLGGDEFIAVLLDVSDLDRVSEVAERVKNAVRTTMEGIAVTSSVGVAIHDGSNAREFVLEDLLHEADLAMYDAKRRGGDSVLIDSPRA